MLSLPDALRISPGRMLEHLLDTAPGQYDVTIFNAEPRVNYDRIMLSPVLSGEKTYEQNVIHGDGWYIEHGITLYKGMRIAAIDTAVKTVTAENGQVEAYDRSEEHTSELQSLMRITYVYIC